MEILFARFADQTEVMVPFSPSQPFPLLTPGSPSTKAAQDHAEQVDAWLGLDVEAVEEELVRRGHCQRAPGASGEKQALWVGLDPRQLLTPYTEIRSLLTRLPLAPGHTVVDLGAAYGRMGFVIARHYPGVKFVGYEYVGERVREGQRAFERWQLKQCRLVHADLSSSEFRLPPADFFFLYDFGTTKAIEKNLHEIRRMADTRPVWLIARGRRCFEAIFQRHSWLSRTDPDGPAAYSLIFQSQSAAEMKFAP